MIPPIRDVSGRKRRPQGWTMGKKKESVRPDDKPNTGSCELPGVFGIFGRFTCDGSGAVRTLDRPGREILDLDNEDESPGSFEETFGIVPSVRASMYEVMKNDSGRFLGEITVRKKDGSSGLILVSEKLQFDGAGRLVGSEGIFAEVSEERRWERELFTIAKNMSGTLDEQEIIDRIALDLWRLTGCPITAVVLFDEDALRVHARSPMKLSRKREEELTHLITHGMGAFLEYTIDSTDLKMEKKVLAGMRTNKTAGRRKIHTYASVPLFIGAKLTGYLHLCRFSSEKISENEKKYLMAVSSSISLALHNARSYDKQRKLVQMKSDFLSNISHSLRTPMATMKQSVSLLLRERGGTVTDTQRKFLEIMSQNIDRLTGVLNNLLDLSKIESGSMELNRTEVNIVYLVESVMVSFEPVLLEKNIELDFSANPSSIKAFVDSEIIRQIIEGIVGNAIKFTKPGRKIGVEIAGTNRRVMISVRDEGCGMSKENLAMAFDKYRSFQVGIKEGVKGTGLGLALTKELVELHGGKIWIESDVGRGTMVSFIIPRMPFASILQEKVNRSMELCKIKNEDLLLFLYIANTGDGTSSAATGNAFREKFIDYLGPVVSRVDGQMLIDEEELRVAIITPVHSNCREGIQRTIGRTIGEILKETGAEDQSLFSWAAYPQEGDTFAELLRSLLARAGLEHAELDPARGR